MQGYSAHATAKTAKSHAAATKNERMKPDRREMRLEANLTVKVYERNENPN